MFPDEMFADLFTEVGRRSAPPMVVAVVTCDGSTPRWAAPSTSSTSSAATSTASRMRRISGDAMLAVLELAVSERLDVTFGRDIARNVRTSSPAVEPPP